MIKTLALRARTPNTTYRKLNRYGNGNLALEKRATKHGHVRHESSTFKVRLLVDHAWIVSRELRTKARSLNCLTSSNRTTTQLDRLSGVQQRCIGLCMYLKYLCSECVAVRVILL